ncbi:hypothetical protein [Candidatus Coxiella mudrowiae]|uniref:hypothetical protein n=1 Tax=Candidatus Coxiella mudrowiae TaxID=2054173 RepID=UPI001F431FA0|nr:hypothetical protein [Candidatus Coxiella mudrowiae]
MGSASNIPPGLRCKVELLRGLQKQSKVLVAGKRSKKRLVALATNRFKADYY